MRAKILFFAGLLMMLLSLSSQVSAQIPGEGWVRIGISYSGNITALAVSPNYEGDKTLFIGVQGNGLWKSYNRGDTWRACAAIPSTETVTGIALPKNYYYGMGLPCFVVTKEGHFYSSTDDFATVQYYFDFATTKGNPCTCIVVGGQTTFAGKIYVGTWGDGVHANLNYGSPADWGKISTAQEDLANCRSLCITNQATQSVWATSSSTGNTIFKYTGSAWAPKNPSALVGADVLSIHSAWTKYQDMWVGTAAHGMWRSGTSGESWVAACDGTTVGGAPFSVNTVRNCPLYLTDNEVWEGRSDGMRTSTDGGASCADGQPSSDIKVIDFTPGYHGSASNYCEAFVGTSSALFRLSCAGGQAGKTPPVIDARALAIAKEAKGLFVGSAARGLFKSVDNATMVEYNNFPNGKIPEIVAVSLHPDYYEGGDCGDQGTLFVAANFTGSPSDNGVYRSEDFGNTWVKLVAGEWPTTDVTMRDLAISPAYADDSTLIAATSAHLFRWVSGYGWDRIGKDTTFSDFTMVALPPTFNRSSGGCSYGGYSGLPCYTVFVSAQQAGIRSLWWANINEDSFQKIEPSNCTLDPQLCPRDITGMAFPSNWCSGSSPSTKTRVSSSTRGVLGCDTINWTSFYALNSGLPTSLNVADIAADPDWVDGSSPTQTNLMCAVAASTPGYTDFGSYFSSSAGNSWSLTQRGKAVAVAYETASTSSNPFGMAGFQRDATYGVSPPYGAFISDDNGQSLNWLSGYWSLPADVFSSVAHERDPNYVFASSPSMGVFVSADKGESFHPYNKGKKGVLGPCRLWGSYAITMLKDRRGGNLDILYAGTTDGIKSRYIYYNSTTGIDLQTEDGSTANGWYHSLLADLSTPTTGYWERLEVVPNTASTYPVWAASPQKGSVPGLGFANLQPGSYNGWTLQTSGLPASPSGKGVRIGYDGCSTAVETLYDGSVVEGAVKQGCWRYYRIDVTDQASTLRVTLDDPDDYGTQDADLYVRYNALPTTSIYDYCPFANGDESVCVTKILGEDFNGSWGPWGNNPPSGWTISDYGSQDPKVWDTNDWYLHPNGTYGNSALIMFEPTEQSNDWLVSPVFEIPSSTLLSSVTLEFDHQFRYWDNNDEFGYVAFKSDQQATWVSLATYSTDMASMGHVSIDLSAYRGHTNCQLLFQYYAYDGWYWLLDNVEVVGRRSAAPYKERLRAGTWYMGVRGYASTNNGYTLSVDLNEPCTQSLVEPPPRQESMRESVPDPRAPVGTATWGTVNGTGVVRGTGTASVNWAGTPTQPANPETQTILQMPDLTLIVGCDASAASDKGIFYSPSPDEGATTWNEAHAIGGASENSRNYVDLLLASNGDVLIACDDSDTADGGVWLSGDKGRNWMKISQGFSSASQALSDLVADNGTPVSYYASTAGTGEAAEESPTGLYTRTITANPYPTISAITPDNGTDQGGTTVTITGTGFGNSCPTGISSDCPDATPRVIFGDTEVAGAWVSATSLTAVTPSHSSGEVAVYVRNPDTRQTSSGVSYIFNFTCLTPSGMANNTASDLAVCSDTGVQVSWTDPSDWGDGGSGTRTFDVLRNGSPIQTGISSATHAYTDTTGINRTSYTYSVRANNGCGQSSSTAGASASDGVAPGAPVIGTITDSSGSCAYGISIPFTGGSGASSHNLYVDGSLALSGVTSPVSYTPADTNSRSYVIRAISGSCYTNSSASSFADTNNTPGQPSIGTITDSSGSCAYGISIPFTAGSGALRHDLYVDGSSWQTGVTSPASCTPADSNSHSYMIRAVNGTCSTSSSAVVFADANSTPATPGAPSAVDVDGCATSGITITWSPAAGATAYDMLVDGVDPYTGVTSPYLFTIGENEPHSFQIRGKNASCTGSWSGTTVASDLDGSPGKPIISGIYDLDVCLTTGIQIVYFEGAGAARHDLYMDGSPVVTGYASGAVYSPGDNNTHSYLVRAISGDCHTDSDAANGKDNNGTPGQPVITEITDLDECLQTGISVIFTPGGGAVSHNLYKDGSVAVAGYSSGAAYDPGDTESHSYTVRAINGTCYTNSEAQDASDEVCSVPPEVATGAGYNWTASQTSQVQAWTAEPAADTYIVYRGTKGTLPGLLDLSEDFCIRSEGASTSLDVSSDDPVPVEGRCFYYLITGVNGAGEGTAGLATGGERQVDSTGGC